MLRLLALLGVAATAGALDNGLGRTPQMGWNSWNCYGGGVTAADLKATADFFVSSGLRDAGYEFVSSDDGWSAGRDAQGRIFAEAAKFPDGMAGVADYVHGLGLKFGLYSAASSVVCSGRVGSLYHEQIDAQTFTSWGVDYVKYDNCGEYGLGNARFVAFADAANATGRSMFISTEPFLLVPNPSHATFSNSWRTTNDINP
jgi:alpha-galactosidase